jgi:hypothetical protein
MLAYAIFFIVLPVQGFVSDVEDMVIRGLIFTISVGAFSAYFGDVLGALAAWIAFLISIMIAAFKVYYW